MKIKAAGATLPMVAYSKWFEEFKKEEPNIEIDYQAVGSGEGVRQLIAGELDFAASDMPLTDEELGKFGVKPHHVPTLVSAVVPVFNVPGAPPDLNFTGEALARIYSGTITRWDDPALVKANPNAALPDAPIIPVHRQDASGTTFVWTNYLSKVSESFKKSVGEGAAVKFPRGKSATGSEGVAELVKKTPNSLGYVDLNYAIKAGDNRGAVQNASGKFQKADLESLGAAADAAAGMPDDFRISITNPPGERAYPICTFTWLIIPAKSDDPAKRRAIRIFLEWMVDKGQKLAMPLDYGILPQPVAEKLKRRVSRL